MKVLIFGVTGMLGSAVLRSFSMSDAFEMWGTLRNSSARSYFPAETQSRLIGDIDVLDTDSLASVIAGVRPNVVINCIGLVKQLTAANDPLQALPINAILPHRLAMLCDISGARLIHISTDCVFSGREGMYTEDHKSDADDLYGMSKYIGETKTYPNAITLRTSIIGHELMSSRSLVDWFLSQEGTVRGYRNAIFSGLPAIELARVIRDFVIPKKSARGLFHVSSDPIDKLTLLQLVAKVYKKNIKIIPDEEVRIDRSLNSERFRAAFGYTPPSWLELVTLMCTHR